MTSDEILSVLDERPFRPFTLHMTDGRHFAVPTAQYLAIKPGSSLFFAWNLKDGGYSFIDARHVVRLEFEAHAEAAAPGAASPAS